MSRATRFILLFLFVGAVVGGGFWLVRSHRMSPRAAYTLRPPGILTFSKDIAPIVFKHCAACHRPGQSAPFSLLTYVEAQKRAKTIAKVTQGRYMPPWLPEPGYGEFVGERRLTEEEISLIGQWVREGSVEGDPKDLPALPKWSEGWQLGAPDLVVQMPQAYTLPAQGKDVYRNFVVPIPISARRYVQAIEFRPSNRSVHHAFLRFDRTRQSRRLDEQDPEPGFGGMRTPESAGGPAGFFLGWQPGRVPSREAEGLAWALESGTDLVLQLHLKPSGKPESIQAAVAFYFTEKPPTRTAFKLGLSSYQIDIPPGARDYTVNDTYKLPVDAEVLAIAPHTHYLGKELQGYALLPDGTRQWLFLIKEWNFNWQGDYRYKQPVLLPKGTTICMRFNYDNSANNPRNPHSPPQRVRYGLETTDEMAEMYLQLLLRNTNDLAALSSDYSWKVLQDTIAFNQYLLTNNPNDPKAHNELGKAALVLGKTTEALQHLRKAVAAQPDFDEPHYHLGLICEDQKKWSEARQEYETALRSNPDNFQAHNNLGLLLLKQGQLVQAEFHFTNALRINPDDEIVRYNLGLLEKVRAFPKRR